MRGEEVGERRDRHRTGDGAGLDKMATTLLLEDEGDTE